MESDNLIQQAANHGQFLMESLAKIPGLENIRGKGLMIGFDTKGPLKDLRKHLLFDKKVFTGTAKPNVVRLLPSLAISKAELEQFLEILGETVEELSQLTVKA
nr:aminotransferase class III-fold pyridoxal phosphate-dependent enzyme [Arachidicoccus ginsenosidivorans]